MNKKEKVAPMQAAWRGVKAYLTDWGNLLRHGLMGIGFLVLAIWAPINSGLKILVIAALVSFNILRMRRKARRQKAVEQMQEQTVQRLQTDVAEKSEQKSDPAAVQRQE